MSGLNRNHELNGIYTLDNAPANLDPSFRLNFVKKDDDGLKMGAERVNPDKGCHISVIKDGMTMTKVTDRKKFRVSRTEKVKWYIWLKEI